LREGEIRASCTVPRLLEGKEKKLKKGEM